MTSFTWYDQPLSLTHCTMLNVRGCTFQAEIYFPYMVVLYCINSRDLVTIFYGSMPTLFIFIVYAVPRSSCLCIKTGNSRFFPPNDSRTLTKQDNRRTYQYLHHTGVSNIFMQIQHTFTGGRRKHVEY